MPAIPTILETHQSNPCGFDTVMQSATWKAFDGWLSDRLRQLETTWQSASSPRAWTASDQRFRRGILR